MVKRWISRSRRLSIMRRIGVVAVYRRLSVYCMGLSNVVTYLLNHSNFYKRESHRKQLFYTVIANTSMAMLMYTLEYFFSLSVQSFWGIDITSSVSNILFLLLSLLVYLVFSYRYCGQFKDMSQMLVRELTRPIQHAWARVNQCLSVLFSLFWSVSALFVFCSVYAIVASVIPGSLWSVFFSSPFPLGAGAICALVGGVTVLGVMAYWFVKFLIVFFIEQRGNFWFRPQWRLEQRKEIPRGGAVYNRGDFFHRFDALLHRLFGAMNDRNTFRRFFSKSMKKMSFLDDLPRIECQISRCFSGRHGQSLYNELENFFRDFFPDYARYVLEANQVQFYEAVYRDQQSLLLDMHLNVWSMDHLITRNISHSDFSAVRNDFRAMLAGYGMLGWGWQQHRTLFQRIFHPSPAVRQEQTQRLVDEYACILSCLFFRFLLAKKINNVVVGYLWEDIVDPVSADTILVPDVLHVIRELAFEDDAHTPLAPPLVHAP